MTKRGDSIRFIVGSRGDDDLKGTAGRDVILGRDGADTLHGGAGNDILVGDGVRWSWNHCFWSKPGGGRDDYLDGGAGSDLLLAGRGNDVANYTLSENARAHDFYDGGTGFDTLQLTLTQAELQLSSVQKDIAAFEAFLARNANTQSDHGRTFHFQSFDLEVRNFEALDIHLVGGNTNTAPVARNDSYSLDEDTVLLVPGPGVTANDTDAEGSALSVTLVAGPAHGALALNANGSFTYTPEANFSGTDSFSYKANDGALDSNVVNVDLAVAPVNDAPVAKDDAVTTAEDMPVSGNVIGNDADADGDALSAALLDGPSHGALDFTADGSFTYTPAANYSGADSFTYQVNDGKANSGVATVQLAVAPVNDAPVAVGDAATTAEDMPVSGNVIGNDADVDGDALSATLLDAPSHGALDFAADGSFTYTPLANFNGMDSFTYKVNDGKLDSNVVTVALAVAPMNDAPVAADDAVTTAEDTPVSGNVIGNDGDVDGDSLTAVLLDEPSHGALDFAADGSFTYTPAADYSGADSFTYQVSDGLANSGAATVQLAVAPVNDAPVAADDAVATAEDTPVSGNVLDNDVDAEDDSLTAALLDGPSHGALDFSAHGTFTYTPAADYFGADSFTYQINDGQANSGVATVQLAIAPVNDMPVANDDVVPERSLASGPIHVAVIGGTTGGMRAAAAQLSDSTAFSIDADAISVKAFSTQAQWATLLENYDVVVLGDNGNGLDYSSTTLFSALHSFVDDGGGVVTTGWFDFIFPNLSGAARADADYITPISTQTYQFAGKNSTVTIVDSTNPITEGIASYKVNALAHELAGGVDVGATVLARGVNGSGASLPALVVDEVGQGHTAYFGSLQMASASPFTPDRVADGPVDQIFERVVAWAAGARDVVASTDEDTPLAIDGATLLANDSDVENDGLAIGAVSATSALGATVSMGAGGSIFYDPTAALQYLKPGQVVTDSFDYSILDGSGGTDIGTVSLTVAGRADTDPLL
jgi:VCBS repeat-containing protein